MTTRQDDPWSAYLALAEWDDAPISQERVRHWPPGAVAEFERIGLLRPTAPVACLNCSECPDEPPRDVVWVPDPANGRQRALLPCSQCGPSEVSIDALRRWAIAWRALVPFLAAGLGATGAAEELNADRLWRLGKTRWAGRPTTLFVGRALHRQDASQILQDLERSSSAVVFVPKRLPTVPTHHPVVTLDLVCGWNGEQLEFDCEFAAAQALPKPATDPRAAAPGRAVIRQRLRAELHAHVDSVCHHVRQQVERGVEPTLLPCPTRAELARRCRSSPATVTRCFEEDRQLQQLWDDAHDLMHVLGRYAEG